MGARSVVVVTFLLAVARAQAQPAPLSLLDVPYVSQSEALCGGAAAAMVLRFWGERGISAETFAPLVDRSAGGIRTDALVADLTARGWSTTAVHGTPELLAGELASGRPAITLIEDRPGVYHYVVPVGATDQAIIFHDPARAPLRVMARDDFERRWQAADEWMAIVLPPPSARLGEAPAPVLPSGSSCDDQVRRGVAQAQANDLDAAERTLLGALSCPGPAASRELAGVRLLQRRWDESAELAAAAAASDPGDLYVWRLLGTSRFLLDQPLAALDAWNRAGEPRLDLVRVDGLERTRHRPVEQLLGLPPGELVTAGTFVRAERALHDLPSARSTRLELVPAPQGVAELHAVVVERPLVPRDAWSYAAIAARAAISRTLDMSFGTLTGGGESVNLEWRFWPRRPRIGASLRAPAPWSGTWGADVYGESQELTDGFGDVQRRGGRLAAARWMSPATRLEVRAGVDRWNTTGPRGAAGATLGVLSSAERVTLRAAADVWAGSTQFGMLSLLLSGTSAPRHLLSNTPANGLVVTGTGGLSLVAGRAPLDLWPGGDTGQARTIPARAHPILLDGRLRTDRVGRAVAFASGEVQYWWPGPAFSRIAGAVFVDALRTDRRLRGAALGDVDAGVGLRLSSALVPGVVQLDYARGLRDGASALSARYVTALW